MGDTNMAAVLLFRNTNMAAMTSREENTLYQVYFICQYTLTGGMSYMLVSSEEGKQEKPEENL